MDPSSSSTIPTVQQAAVEVLVGGLDARVIDQSHDNTYNAQNIHIGAQININSQSAPPAKEELPPLPRCPAPCTGYVRRRALEAHMSSYFFGSGRDGDRRKQFVLHGLGGSGKTQGALSFIDQNYYSQEPGKERFSEAYWVDATTIDTITKSLADIALSVGMSKPEDALALLASRNSKSNWIMLYNNADDPSLDLTKYFPKCTHGNIIVTTRNRQAARYGLGPGSDYAVSEMERDEAQELFMNQARLFDTSPTTMQAVDQLITELHHFPLSIRQSGAYIFATSCTPAEYLDKFRNRRKQLLRKHDEMTAEDYQYGTVEATLSLSFGQLSPRGQYLLRLFACFHKEYILEKIFQDGFSGLHFYKRYYRRLATKDEKRTIASMNQFREHLITSGRWDVERFRGSLGELKSLSFITSTPEQQMYSIHTLVQEWTRGATNKATQTLSWRSTTLLLGSAIEENQARTTEELSFLRAVLPHLDELLKREEDIFSGCRSGFSDVYKNVGRWSEVMSLRKRYNEACQEGLGRQHVKSLGSMNDFAGAYQAQGNYEKAVEMHAEVFEIRKVKLGVDHPDTLMSMNNLASTYRHQGHYEKAAEMQSEVFEISKVKLGVDHPSALTLMHNLALTYQHQGHYEKAAEMQSEVFEICKVKLGVDHPDTLTSMNNLALTYQYQGHYEKAAEMQSEVFEIWKVKLGVDHPSTLTSMNNLASTYQHQGHYEKAAEMQSEVFEIHKVKLGVDHPSTLTSMNNLALTYQYQGHYEKAAEMQSEVFEIRKVKQGVDHPDTLKSMHNLALTYRYQGHYVKAAEMQSEVFEISKVKLGVDHPDTLISMNQLGLTYQYQGHYEKAAEMQSEVFEIHKVKLGVDHPDTLTSMNNLALNYSYQGHYEKAAEMHSEEFEISKVKLGINHPDTLTSIYNLASIYQDLENFTKAAQLFSQLIELQIVRFGVNHPETQDSIKSLQSITEQQRELTTSAGFDSGALTAEHSGLQHLVHSLGPPPQSPASIVSTLPKTIGPIGIHDCDAHACSPPSSHALESFATEQSHIQESTSFLATTHTDLSAPSTVQIRASSSLDRQEHTSHPSLVDHAKIPEPPSPMVVYKTCGVSQSTLEATRSQGSAGPGTIVTQGESKTRLSKRKRDNADEGSAEAEQDNATTRYLGPPTLERSRS